MRLPPDVHFDFAVLLTVLALLTGIGWVLDKFWLAPRRRDRVGDDKPSWLIDFARSFFPVIFAVLVLRSFLAEPFRIPSGSMIPTLLVGDFILVNKFAYGVRDPVFHHRFLDTGAPERGDIVVFRWPRDTSTDFIKRIVGLPGDRISYRDKQLTINGEPALLTPEGSYGATTPGGGVAHRLGEQLGTVSHHVLVNPGTPAQDFDFTVPSGEYFAMGDNRDGSFDSRGWGTVPEKNLVGKAFLIWMSIDFQNWRVYFSRVGTRIR